MTNASTHTNRQRKSNQANILYHKSYVKRPFCSMFSFKHIAAYKNPHETNIQVFHSFSFKFVFVLIFVITILHYLSNN